MRALEYYGKVKEAHPDFKVVLGNEIYLTRNGLTRQNFQRGVDRYYHFILIAKDEIGHRQIREISTRAWSHSYMAYGMRRVPTYYQDLTDVIGDEKGHLFATTSCLGGTLGSQLLIYSKTGEEERLLRIKQWLKQMEDIFGKGNFFMEMQPSHNKEQRYVNDTIIKFSKELDIPFTISLDAHYLRKEDRPIHKAFLNSQNGDREVDAFYETTYMMGTDEIYEYMEKYIGADNIAAAFQNNARVFEECKDYSLNRPLHIPYLPKKPRLLTSEQISKWKDTIQHLEEFDQSKYESDRHLIAEVIYRVESDDQYQNEETYKEIDVCLESIKVSSEVMNTPWSAYLLNVKDYIDLIWEKGDSLVGCGRGSGVGFILLNILGITQVNPLRENSQTYPWRFLHKERASVLDIDFDTEAGKRSQIIKTFQEEYGADKVSKVMTLKTEKSKSAIQTAARGLGIDVDTAQYISSLIVSERGLTRTLSQTYYGDEEEGIHPNKEFVRLMDEEYPELWQVAKHVEGLINGVG